MRASSNCFHKKKNHKKYFKYSTTLLANYNLGAAAISEPGQLEPSIVMVAPQ
jgi:hypothetical protein